MINIETLIHDLKNLEQLDKAIGLCGGKSILLSVSGIEVQINGHLDDAKRLCLKHISTALTDLRVHMTNEIAGLMVGDEL